MHQTIAIVIIRRKNGDLYVHQRLSSKRQFANLYGLGAGGSVEPGEDPREGAERELREETGLTESVVPLFSLDYQAAREQETLWVFELRTEQEPRHDPSEWQWSGWLSMAAVAELARRGRLCPDTELVFLRYREIQGSR